MAEVSRANAPYLLSRTSRPRYIAIWQITEVCGVCDSVNCTAWDPPRPCCAANCIFGQPLRPDEDKDDRAFLEGNGPHYPHIDSPRGDWVRLNDPGAFDEMAFCNMEFNGVVRYRLLNQPFHDAGIRPDGYLLVIRVAVEKGKPAPTPEEVVAFLQAAIQQDSILRESGATVETAVDAEAENGAVHAVIRLPRSLAVREQVDALARAGIRLLKQHCPSVLPPWVFTLQEMVETGWHVRLASRYAWEVFRPDGSTFAFIANRDRYNRPIQFPIRALKIFRDLQVLDAKRQGLPVPAEVLKEVR